MTKIVAVTNCPAGIAHTYMVAEKIEDEAKKRGYEVHVETQGASGVENKLTSKQYLALNKSRIQSYDGQCGYLAVTAITYDLLAWQERQSTDDKTMGDLFYLMNESLPDIKFVDTLVYLISAFKKIAFDVSEKSMN